MARVASLHGFGDRPSFERIKEQLDAKWHGPDVSRSMRQWFNRKPTARDAVRATEADQLVRASPDSMLNGWYALASWFAKQSQSLPSERRLRERHHLCADASTRSGQTIEHDALRRRKIDAGRRKCRPARRASLIFAPSMGTLELRRRLCQRVAADLSRAGIEDIVLIRNLDMVEFSFGFTRVSATPETDQKNLRMPVRLKGFPRLPNSKRPIYVIEQQNEAIYIQLSPADCRGVSPGQRSDQPPPPPPRTLGSIAHRDLSGFRPFLEDFSVRDRGSRARQRDIASMTYLSAAHLSHHVMHGIARFSGLDLGSLSEVIFPADLAFVVHRRGMTEDLGNISSMWRDQNAAFLRYLVSRRELRCGSGTLCDHRGGACPACIMVPETSCRRRQPISFPSVPVGGRAPLWDLNRRDLRATTRSLLRGRRPLQPASALMPLDADVVSCAAPWPGTAAPAFLKASPRSDPASGSSTISARRPTLASIQEPRTRSWLVSAPRVSATSPKTIPGPPLVRQPSCCGLAQVLKGADHYRRLRKEASAIELAMTMPMAPSHLERELATVGARRGGFLDTPSAFMRIAQSASADLFDGPLH